MKWLIGLLCFLPLTLAAQRIPAEPLLVSTDSARLINLPRLNRLEIYKIEDSIYNLKKSLDINTPELYYKVFSRFDRDSLPQIDFKQHFLKAHSYCIYSGISGTESVRKCGHRQACSYNITWLLVKRKPSP